MTLQETSELLSVIEKDKLDFLLNSGDLEKICDLLLGHIHLFRPYLIDHLQKLVFDSIEQKQVIITAPQGLMALYILSEKKDEAAHVALVSLLENTLNAADELGGEHVVQSMLNPTTDFRARTVMARHPKIAHDGRFQQSTFDSYMRKKALKEKKRDKTKAQRQSRKKMRH